MIIYKDRITDTTQEGNYRQAVAQKRGTITSQEQEGSENVAQDVTQYVKHDAQDVS